MRAYVMEGYGPPSLARPDDLPRPEPKAGEVLIRVAAAGVNPADWKEMGGFLAKYFPPYPPRWAAGKEGAGIVEALGDGTEGFTPGDRVVFFSDPRDGKSGSFAEFVRVNRRFVARVPDAVSLSVAATLPIAGITAFQALTLPSAGNARSGEAILVYGASGGLGSYMTAVAKAHGLRVLATCRQENADYVRGLGADAVFDYSTEDVVATTRRLAPDGVDIIFDTNSGGARRDLLDALKPGGRLIVSETATNDSDLTPIHVEAERRGLRVHYLVLDHLRIADDAAVMMGLLNDGKMRAPSVTAFPLERAGEAIDRLRAGKLRGKLIIKVADIG